MPGKNKIKIRKFRPADLNAVKRLIHNTINVCYPAIYCLEAIKYIKNYHSRENILKGAKKGYTIVLERGDRIIATGTVIKNGYITRVFVNPKFHKHGFGRLIMEKLHTKALSAGIKTIKLDSTLTAKEFYDSLGYKTIKKTFVKVENGKKLNYYKMKKLLKQKNERV
ncbi:MAG: GNAT family N-acetyltransferase [Sedimentisphaerales bacterium]